MQQLKTKPWRRSLSPGARENQKKIKNQKFETIAIDFLKKLLKFVIFKSWKHSITSRNNEVTYYKNPTGGSFALEARQKLFKKLRTNCKLKTWKKGIRKR